MVVQPLRDDTIAGFDLAIFSAGGATSGEWAPRFVDAGAVVVDNSSRWRMQDDVPLVVSEVNPEALDAHRGIIANPNCSTMQMVVALKPLQDAAGIERLVISTYQAVVGHRQGGGGRAPRPVPGGRGRGGRPAGRRLRRTRSPSTRSRTRAPSPRATTTPTRSASSSTRRARSSATRRSRVSATCVRVPVVHGHSESVNVQTREPLSADDARALLRAAPGVTVVDDPGAGVYPLALDATGRDDVLVGRIRRDPGHERALDLWVVADNLRKGAATNAVQLAELLHERGLVGARV